MQSNRMFKAICLAVIGVLFVVSDAPINAQTSGLSASSAPAASGQKYSLKTSRAVGAIDKVSYQLDIQGNLMIPSEKEKGKMDKFPVKATTKLAYTEKTNSYSAKEGGFQLEALRNYQTVKTERTVDTETDSITLPPEKRILEVDVNGASSTIFHKQFCMNQSELDVLEVMASSLMLDSLLPKTPVGVEDEWSIPEESLAALLQLDSLTQAQVAQRFTELKGTTAVIDAQGLAEGMSDGVKTVINFKLKYYFSMKARRIIWVGMVTNEQRQSGPVTPGLAIESRVSMTVTPGAADADLTAEKWVKPSPELLLVHFTSSDGSWSMFHNRGWHIIQDTENQTVFRFMHLGNYIAQCVINKPNNPNATRAMTLAQFKAEVEGAVKEESAATRAVVSANEEASPAGIQIYQVIAEDSKDGSQWAYYMLKGTKNEQLVFMFMLDKKNAENIGVTDMEMVGTLTFNSK